MESEDPPRRLPHARHLSRATRRIGDDKVRAKEQGQSRENVRLADDVHDSHLLRTRDVGDGPLLTHLLQRSNLAVVDLAVLVPLQQGCLLVRPESNLELAAVGGHVDDPLQLLEDALPLSQDVIADALVKHVAELLLLFLLQGGLTVCPALCECLQRVGVVKE